jgi:uncharacterized protein (TIGR03089 family)
VPELPVTSVFTLLTRDPGRPRLTWYGDAGERVELSGAVLANWVTKTANLLVEEVDAGPHVHVRLDLPGHWRAVVWALAVWRVGACVVVGHDEPATVTVTPDPAAHRGTVVAVALPALARRFAGDLPPGAIDGAAVLGYGDALGWVPPPDLDAPALVGRSGTTPHVSLLRPDPSAERVLLDADAAPLDLLLARVLGVLAADGSVVLAGGSSASGLRVDDERRAALVASERVTA